MPATYNEEAPYEPLTEERTDSPDGEFDGDGDVSFYQLSDKKLSVHAIVAVGMGLNGRVREEIEYEPYGQSRRTAQGDFNRDGTFGVQDTFDFFAARFAGDPSSDENEDGQLGMQDIFDFLAEYLNPDATPRDRLSSLFFDNPYGYCGYYADSETAAAQVLGPAKRNTTNGAVIDGSGCLYHVRHRVYDPSLGRWLTRDPAGFVDGMNLYEYCAGSAIDAMDPSGLRSDDSKLWCPQESKPSGESWGSDEGFAYLFDWWDGDLEEEQAETDGSIREGLASVDRNLDAAVERGDLTEEQAEHLKKKFHSAQWADSQAIRDAHRVMNEWIGDTAKTTAYGLLSLVGGAVAKHLFNAVAKAMSGGRDIVNRTVTWLDEAAGMSADARA